MRAHVQTYRPFPTDLRDEERLAVAYGGGSTVGDQQVEGEAEYHGRRRQDLGPSCLSKGQLRQALRYAKEEHATGVGRSG